MFESVEFDKASFLRQGAIFAREDEVWLLWGRPQTYQQRPEAIAVFSQDFFCEEKIQWQLYPYAIQVTREIGKSFFKSQPHPLPWQEASRELFRKQFQKIMEGFANQSLEKVVPYVFETTTEFSVEQSLEHWLGHSLPFEKGFLYGQWEDGQGVLGLTPEILLTQEAHNQFSTMALAGTCSLESYQQDPDAFLNDPKEKKEHLKVVEDIVQTLEGCGTLELSDMEVKTTPHLAHLMTEVQFCKTTEIDLEDLVQKMHPTPALGAFPRVQGLKLLREFDQWLPRKVFGAPFGISYSRNEADVVVGIRNIFWRDGELFLGSGCGVVPESSEDKEWHELENKRKSIKAIFGV